MFLVINILQFFFLQIGLQGAFSKLNVQFRQQVACSARKCPLCFHSRKRTVFVQHETATEPGETMFQMSEILNVPKSTRLLFILPPICRSGTWFLISWSRKGTLKSPKSSRHVPLTSLCSGCTVQTVQKPEFPPMQRHLPEPHLPVSARNVSPAVRRNQAIQQQLKGNKII